MSNRGTVTLYDYTTDSEGNWDVDFDVWEGEVEVLELRNHSTGETVSGFESAERFGDLVTKLKEMLDGDSRS